MIICEVAYMIRSSNVEGLRFDFFEPIDVKRISPKHPNSFVRPLLNRFDKRKPLLIADIAIAYA